MWILGSIQTQRTWIIVWTSGKCCVELQPRATSPEENGNEDDTAVMKPAGCLGNRPWSRKFWAYDCFGFRKRWINARDFNSTVLWRAQQTNGKQNLMKTKSCADLHCVKETVAGHSVIRQHCGQWNWNNFTFRQNPEFSPWRLVRLWSYQSFQLYVIEEAF